MNFDPQSGLLGEAMYIASPNCDERPANTCIDLIVIHNISLPPQQFGGNEVRDFFLNQLDHSAHPFFEQLKDVRVSAHLFIRRCGELLQFVPLTKRAWHAGLSHFKGREKCNDFSIGIELEGEDEVAYTDAQYEQLNKVIKTVRHYYPAISAENIVGHREIAPERKTDPGIAFDWSRVQTKI